jgi:hypothetical protein
LQTERLVQGGKANNRVTVVDKVILSQYDATDRLEHCSYKRINQLIVRYESIDT